MPCDSSRKDIEMLVSKTSVGKYGQTSKILHNVAIMRLYRYECAY